MRYLHAMDQFNVVSSIVKLIATTYLLVFKDFIQMLFVTESTSPIRFLRFGIVNSYSTIIEEKSCYKPDGTVSLIIT